MLRPYKGFAGWGRGLFVVGVFRFAEAGAAEEAAEAGFAAGAALVGGDVAVAVNDRIDGIDVGLVHGGEVGVFHHDDFGGTGMLVEVFFDGFLRFSDVYGEN